MAGESEPGRGAADWMQLHPADNVGCLLRTLVRGQRLRIGDQELALSRDLGLGHKIALRDLRAGEKILKFGFPIGSATEDIPAGAHVHLHNMKSDYLPTYTLDRERKAYGR